MKRRKAAKRKKTGHKFWFTNPSRHNRRRYFKTQVCFILQRYRIPPILTFYNNIELFLVFLVFLIFFSFFPFLHFIIRTCAFIVYRCRFLCVDEQGYAGGQLVVLFNDTIRKVDKELSKAPLGCCVVTKD